MIGIVNTGRAGGIALALAFAASPAAGAGKCDLKQGVGAEQARAGLCGFDVDKKSFAGTPARQAACLTREVKRAGHIGAETITPFLKGLAGQPAPAVQAVQALLDGQQLKAAELGGPLNRQVLANYFIIHDTSTPNCSEGTSAACPTRGEFPPNRDDASWTFNTHFGGHPKKFPDRAAHAFTSRIGTSITEVDFADPIATTKFETCADRKAKAGLFVGVENIQPRVGDPKIPAPGATANDRDAPDPGFTAKQYERLALLYMVASTRRGVWLIPAFHAVLDNRYAGGHDDPQRFDMAAFSAAVQKQAAAIAGTTPPATVTAATIMATAAAAPAQPQDELPKHPFPAFDPPACKRIAASADSFKAEKTSETTQYFTPLFRPGPDGGLRSEDRDNCLKMEGSCIVGNYLYNAGGQDGQRFDRAKVKFIFGQGNGAGEFNTTNALVPCRTLAADTKHYPIGTVVYLAAFKGKTCPQNGQPVDGCFIVGDVGSKIKGQGRFDIFTGECARYDGKNHFCRDKANQAFNVPAQTGFRVLPRESDLARALRSEVDAFIDNGWKPTPP